MFHVFSPLSSLIGTVNGYFNLPSWDTIRILWKDHPKIFQGHAKQKVLQHFFQSSTVLLKTVGFRNFKKPTAHNLTYEIFF
jgi:hypothetical protein